MGNEPIPVSATPRWIEAADNPFGIRIFDCRPFTRTSISASEDPDMAFQFLAGRRDDGTRLKGKLPESPTKSACRLRYGVDTTLSDGPQFRAAEMEDKWDIDLFDKRLYFSRSWSGELIYVAEMVDVEGGIGISAVTYPVKAGSPELAIAAVDFLIKSHLLGQDTPHQLAPNVPNEEQPILMVSLSHFGRYAAFATYADTTRIAS